jgi:hypothetical protein
LEALFRAIVPDGFEESEEEENTEEDGMGVEEDPEGNDPSCTTKTTATHKRHPASGFMSDDESDLDTPNISRTYIINPATWRSPQIATALRFLDSQLPDIRRERAPGNVARHRRFSQNEFRIPSLPRANRKGLVQGAPTGLPKNYYDPDWMDLLRLEDREKLRERPARAWDRALVFR